MQVCGQLAWRLCQEVVSHLVPFLVTRSRFQYLSLYARDELVQLSSQDYVSAAVVFLPERTPNYGKHGIKCYCLEMYGIVAPWGCKVPLD